MAASCSGVRQDGNVREAGFIGDWLPGRKVLVSPMLFEVPELEARELTVDRTCEQIRNSPDIDTERPVSRQQEAAYLSYYNYPFYWGGTGLWGGEMYPELLGPARGSLLSAVPGGGTYEAVLGQSLRLMGSVVRSCCRMMHGRAQSRNKR